MNPRYCYLELDIELLEKSNHPTLSAQTLIQEVGRDLFGEVGSPAVDVLKAQGSRALVRVPAPLLRRFRAAAALSRRRIHVCAQASSLQAGAMSAAGRTEWASGDGRHRVVVAAREQLAAPSAVALPPPEPAPGLILPSGDINWGCPCLGGMATGPCGPQFRDAFSCFHYSEAEPKGSDCYEKFSVMQECMSHYPELYGKDDDDDELAAALDQAGAGEGAGDAAQGAAAGPAEEGGARAAAQ